MDVITINMFNISNENSYSLVYKCFEKLFTSLSFNNSTIEFSYVQTTQSLSMDVITKVVKSIELCHNSYLSKKLSYYIHFHLNV